MNTKNEIEGTETGATVFAGPKAVGVFQAAAIAHALRFYAKTGMRVNRAYTPKAMMATAERILGKKFKPRAYVEAADELKAFATAQAALIHVENNAAAATGSES